MIEFDDFKLSSTWLEGEKERRLARAQKLQAFGIDYLDDAMVGLFPDDVVLLGARTGLGKTALASMLAHEGSKAGRRVGFIALEASKGEIEQRILYRSLAQEFFDDQDRDRMARVSYGNWVAGRCEGAFARYERNVRERLAEETRHMRTYYRTRQFGPGDLTRIMLANRELVDMFILDHFHYIDGDGDVSENRFQAELTKLISDLALDMGLPVIVVAHLRKGDARDERILPTLDDFMGSSHLVKIATRAVLMGYHQGAATQDGVVRTVMHVAKDRIVGTTRYVGEMDFDRARGAYLPGYSLKELADKGRALEVPAKLPAWATRSA